MITFSRILELSGRKLLTEALSPQEATNIFRYHGATDADFADEASLKKARKRLMLANHPDRAGAEGLEAAKEINAAYDTLKNSGAVKTATRNTRDHNNKNNGGYKKPDQGDTSWDTDPRGPHNISGKDDVNYFKKRMWELCGKSRKNRYTIWNFDGHFFRGCVTVFGSPEIFAEMAKGMRDWDRFNKSRAIFIDRDNGDGECDLYLIWSDGKDRDPPILFEHDSFNSNPGNDQQFVRKLPEMLDKIKAGD